MGGNTLETLVDDVYTLMQNKNSAKGVDTEAEIDKFGEAMKDLMRKEFLPNVQNFAGRGGLRLSSIGKPELQQWYSVNKFRGEKIQPHTYIKFMYGHLIEEMLLFFVRLSGHKVTDEQKKCTVGDITGHMDCKIDGIVTDVKSTTKFGIKKFEDGTLAASDSFGYVDQIKAYAHSEGERKWAWLAMDRDSGRLAVLEYDLDDTDHPMHGIYSADIEERVAHVKKSVGGEDRPSPCSYPEEDGKSGNLKLSTICSYCQYKKHCYPTLRAFALSSGPKFMTHVVNVPTNKFKKPYPEIDLNEEN
tara:strand:+ start:129 stop:1034 length:906 start_codon:yes stop_codon:yes gene_type:complete